MSGADSRALLAGRTVAVTRPQHGADDLAERLRVVGADPFMAPLVRIEPAGGSALGESLSHLEVYDWVVFTSATAVQRVADELRGAAAAQQPRVAVVGAATAAAVAGLLGWTVSVIPDRYAGDALVPAMLEAAPLQGARVLWPRAQGARDVVAADLEDAGARLDAPVVYRTVADGDVARELVRRIDDGSVDIVTFTAPSAVAAFAAAGVPRREFVVAVIGPVTAQACAEHGVAVHIMPGEHTIAALVDELVRRGANER